MTEPRSDALKQLWSLQNKFTQLTEDARQLFEIGLEDDRGSIGSFNPSLLKDEQWEQLIANHAQQRVLEKELRDFWLTGQVLAPDLLE